MDDEIRLRGGKVLARKQFGEITTENTTDGKATRGNVRAEKEG